MKKLRRILLIVGLIVYAINTNAQSALTFEATQQYASFKFIDSRGNDLSNEYQGIFTGSYGIGYRWVADFGLIVRTGLGMRNAGANMVYDDMNYSWNLKYANTNLGIGYRYNLDRVSPYFLASGYLGYLLNGTQTLNNEHFNISQMGLLNDTDFGVILSPGIELKLSPQFSSFFEFKYLFGLYNIEMDDAQEAFNNAFALSLGVSFSFLK